MHHHAKFRRDRPTHRGNIEVYRFYKMASVRHVGFVDRVFWTPHDEPLVVSTTVQNLVEIGAAVSEIRGGPQNLSKCAFF